MSNKRYSGIFDSIVDNILEKYGIEEKTIKQISKVVSTISDHVTTEKIGDETFVTIHLDKIHFKFKKD